MISTNISANIRTDISSGTPQTGADTQAGIQTSIKSNPAIVGSLQTLLWGDEKSFAAASNGLAVFTGYDNQMEQLGQIIEVLADEKDRKDTICLMEQNVRARWERHTLYSPEVVLQNAAETLATLLDELEKENGASARTTPSILATLDMCQEDVAGGCWNPEDGLRYLRGERINFFGR